MPQTWQYEPQPTDNGLLRLQLTWNYQWDQQIERNYLDFPYPDGRLRQLLVGNPDGILTATITMPLLPNASEMSVQWFEDDQWKTISRAHYIWKFYNHHMSPHVLPFILPELLFDRDVRWTFANPNLSYKQILHYLWTSGLQLREWIDDEPFTSTDQNPQNI